MKKKRLARPRRRAGSESPSGETRSVSGLVKITRQSPGGRPSGGDLTKGRRTGGAFSFGVAGRHVPFSAEPGLRERAVSGVAAAVTRPAGPRYAGGGDRCPGDPSRARRTGSAFSFVVSGRHVPFAVEPGLGEISFSQYHGLRAVDGPATAVGNAGGVRSAICAISEQMPGYQVES